MTLQRELTKEEKEDLPEGAPLAPAEEAVFVFKNYDPKKNAQRSEYRAKQKMPKWAVEEDFVISGMSGRFPESDSIEEFKSNLYNNVDMVCEDERRWPYGHMGLPHGSGKIKDISRFDNRFFNVPEKEANFMDSQVRMMLEITFEALWDAGLDPSCLAGSKTGVFLGNSFDEYMLAYSQDYTSIPDYKQCFYGMLANVFDFRGPSKPFDTACASGFSALHEAMVSVRSGECERAIVVGLNLCLRADTQHQFLQLNMISPDGHCKCLDDDANGYAKGEACVAFLLQRRSEAKRIYATVVHTKTNCDGYKDLGITYPSFELQRDLIADTYQEAQLSPLVVDYCEAHCTGTQAGDPSEMRAITESMCQGRTKPLLIGAIKSVIGHTEAASGLCSLVKTILSFENELIPANLNMSKPNHRIDGLVSGILQPVITNTPFTGKYISLNCFGFGGVNVNAIIKKHDMEADSVTLEKSKGSLPRLVVFCGRNPETLDKFADFFKNNPSKLTPGYLSLLNDVSKTSPFPSRMFKGMRHRGFMLLAEKEGSPEECLFPVSEVVASKVKDTEKPPFCFVFTGMGCQWAAMGTQLTAFPIICAALNKCTKVLQSIEPSIDLMAIITDTSGELLKTPLNAFVAIAAIQIGLVDLLSEMGITADYIVGHSIGELTCAYADGCLSLEETISCAYWRGKCVEELKKEEGSMAAVACTWEEATEWCTTLSGGTVWPACHNGEDSVTVSGKREDVEAFLEKLRQKNGDIFTRIVASSGLAFHSPLIEGIRKPLLSQVNDLLASKPSRKISSRWIGSTYAVGEENENLDGAYLVDNLILPVRFHEALQKVPGNAVFLEVGPHHLLQAIIKRTLLSSANQSGPVKYVATLSRGKDNVISLLSSLGQLYGHGYNPTIESLYPKVEYPVARNTAPLHSFIQWRHDRPFTVTQYPEFYNQSRLNKFAKTFDLQHADDKHLSGHCIDGRILFPATGYLFFAWTSLAQHLKLDWKEMPVIFEDVILHRATLMPKSGMTTFEVSFLQGSGHFAIKESGTVTTSGKISVPPTGDFLKHQGLLESIGQLEGQTPLMEMKNKDIYKEFRLRGYDYGPEFQTVQSIRLVDQCLSAKVLCQNWVSFVDGLIQLAVLGQPTRGLYLPVRLDSLRCDPREVFKSTEEGPRLFDALFDGALNIGVAAGIEYHCIKANLAPRKIAQSPVEETFEFVAHQELGLPYTASRAFSEKRCQAMTTQLKDYEEVCSKLLENPNREWKEEESAQFERNHESEVSSPVLLRLLRQIAAQPEDSPLEGEKQLQVLEDDLLFRTYQTERFLRSQLEIACEQLQVTTLQILEVNQTPTILASSLLRLLRLSSFKLNFNYRLLHSGLEKFQSLDLDSTHSQHDWLAEKSKFPTDIVDVDLIVYKDSSTCPLLGQATVNFDSILKAMWTALAERGFALLLLRDAPFQVEQHLARLLGKELPFGKGQPSRVATLEGALEKSTFTVMSHKSDAFGVHAYLLRKLSVELIFEEQIFLPVSNNVSDWFTPVQEAIRKLNNDEQNNNGRVWLLANEATSGVIGFLTCLYKEPLGHKVRAILNTDPTTELTVDSPVIKEILKLDMSTNVLAPGGRLGAYKHFTLPVEDHEPTPVEHCFLNVAQRGDLSSLKWFESAHKYWPLNQKTSEQILCTVYYSALNFRDIMLATGRLPPDALPDNMGLDECILGLEFAGRDANQNRIMGFVVAKGLATTLLKKNSSFLWPIPPQWSMEEAATVPVAYSTAYYALLIRGKLQEGEKVLIHSGSGAVGQASIAVCLSLNCQLFITVGSEAKRDVLLNLFPQLKPNQFASSRNTDFSKQILQATGGKGVDVILNSLADEKLQASVDCLAEFGRFLEIGKYDMSENNPLDLSKIMQNKTFHGILLDNLFNLEISAPKLIQRHRRMIFSYLSEGIASGVVRPLERTIFTVEQSEEAFRYMSTGKHIGKVILCIRPEETPDKGGVIKIADNLKIPAIPRTIFLSHKSYIITGGLGGFGLELINWMIDRMARQFVVTSRSGVKDLYQKTRLDYFASIGATVRIFTQDASTLSGAEGLIKEAETMGPIGGVFHLAMVLSDGLFDNQTLESFETAVKPKATTFAHLDSLTRNNHSKPPVDYFVAFSSVSCGMGNPGQSNYGYANSVMERICEQRRYQGLHGLALQWGPIGDVGYIIDNVRGNDLIVCGAIPQRLPSCLAVLDRLLQTSFSVCSSLLKVDYSFDGAGGKASLIKTIAHILGLKDYATLDKALTLSELGMDSLMGVEVKQAIERDYDVILAMNDIRKLTVGKILEIGSGKCKRTEEGASVEGGQGGATDEILMPTVAVTYLNDIVNGEPIIFLPQIDASYEQMRPIAGKLNRPAIGLNWTNECKDLQTLPAAASHFIEVLERALPQLEGNYDVIGYSFGGLLAIEMAIQLHARRNSSSTSRLGPYRNLILLDSSPKQFKIFTDEAILKYKIKNTQTDEAYTESILMFLTASLNIDYGKIRELLFAMEDIPKRIAFVRDLFKQLANLDIAMDTLSFLIQSHYNKMLMMNSYECPTKALPGNLMLVRASQTLVKDTEVDIREDYWLGELITGKCQVHILPGDHKTFITDNYPPLIELIQKYFE